MRVCFLSGKLHPLFYSNFVMLKKIFIFLIPLFSPYVASATPGVAPETQKEDPVITDHKIGDQWEAVPLTAPSEEVNYVEESEMARKALQAEKAKNAAQYDSFGGGITIISMCIVLGALIVLSILFYIFGNISSWFLSHKKKQVSKKTSTSADEDKTHAPDTGDVIAAISAALAQHFATDHDMEDTILTIQKLRKAYSPWNSKIYNMRHLPEVSHNHPKLK